MGLVGHIVTVVIVYLGFLMLACPSSGDGLTMEEELQELTENYVRFKEAVQAKNVQLGETIRKLEGQLQQNSEIKKALEAKVMRLESELQQQESRLAPLNPSVLTEGNIKLVSISDTQPVGMGVLKKMATSYVDPRHPGTISNEFYLLIRNATVDNVFCSLTKDPDSLGFRQSSEYGNLTSSPVYFFVQRDKLVSKESTSIPFDLDRIDVGKVINESFGKFTTSQTGTYSFIFNGLANKFSASSFLLPLGLSIQLNGSQLTRRRAEVGDYVIGDKVISLALPATLKLASGDQVWLEISSLSSGVVLYDNDNGTHFTCVNGSFLQ